MIYSCMFIVVYAIDFFILLSGGMIAAINIYHKNWFEAAAGVVCLWFGWWLFNQLPKKPV